MSAPLPHILMLLTPPDARLAALIGQAGLERRVAIADFQANPYPWMAAADLLVLCSDHEGPPNVLIEALAAAMRAAVAAPKPGAEDIAAALAPHAAEQALDAWAALVRESA